MKLHQAADRAHGLLRPGGLGVSHRGGGAAVLRRPDPLGVLTQTAGAFAEVQGSLSWFIDSYGQLAAWKATLDRLTGFRGAIGKAKAEAQERA